MIRSMTCFSRVQTVTRHHQWSVEIRSLNHRYFDLSAKLPQEYQNLETKIRDLVKAQIGRGKLTLILSKNSDDDNEPLQLDTKIAQKYLKSIRQLKKKCKVQGEVTAMDLITLPKIFTSQKKTISMEKEWRVIKKAVQQALTLALKAKSQEGISIVKDISKRLVLIQKSVHRIEQLVVKRKDYYFEKLKQRVAALIEESKVDQDRLMHEVALFADRSDITEEIVRLRSHLKLFGKKLKVTTDVGREMDFLCQEMHREANTMGSKGQFFDISKEVIQIKGEIEKIREQVQNVE